jgi:hypothetical protein
MGCWSLETGVAHRKAAAQHLPQKLILNPQHLLKEISWQ